MFKFKLKFLSMKNISIFLLGSISALIYSLSSHTLTLWLTDLKVRSTFLGFVSAGYIIHALRIFWIPIFEKFDIPFLSRFLDRSSSWVVCFICLGGISLVRVSYLNPSSDLVMFIACIVIACVSMSIVDTLLRSKIIRMSNDSNEQTVLSGLGAFGFKLGMFCATQLFLLLAIRFGFTWEMIYRVCGTFIVLSSGIVFLLPNVENTESKSLSALLILPIKDFLQRHKGHVKYIVGFMVFFRLQDKLLAPVVAKFFYSLKPKSVIPVLDSMTGREIFAWSKTLGALLMAFGVLGSIALLKKYSYRTNAIFSVILHSLSCIPLFILNNQSSHAVSFIFFTLLLEKVIRTLSTNVYYLYQPRFCNKQYASGQIAFIGFVETVSGAVLGISSGYLVQYFSWNVLFIIASFVSLPVLYFVYKLPKDL
ncbi:MAG: hypothetical protein H6845_00665 [Alphaproteobacteria bacterium]|nr:MAG: hypothetical protein H6845_00665 [Alphaproteobacteria bacterium]